MPETVDIIPEPNEAPKGNREARYRTERNGARAERDSIAELLESYQLRELERSASEVLSNPGDLLILTGKSLADFLSEDGSVNTELVAEAATEVVGGRPGLKRSSPLIDHTQGSSGPVPSIEPSWMDLLN